MNKKAFPYWKFVMAQDKLDYDEFINKVKNIVSMMLELHPNMEIKL